MIRFERLVPLIALLFATATASAQTPSAYPANEGEYVAHDFKFKSTEQLPELRLHYRTLGKLALNAPGRATNAVLILHGTGGSGQQFLQPQFAGELFGPGQLLDINRYFIILPDGIGHGKSSKPSDGMHAHFPAYDYDDMVAAEHLLVTQGLDVQHLRLIVGTSMGCMHSFVWPKLTRISLTDHAHGLPARTDCGAQSRLAKNVDGCNPQRSGLEWRRVQGRAEGRTADGGRHSCNRRKRATADAEDAFNSRCGGQICRGRRQAGRCAGCQ